MPAACASALLKKPPDGNLCLSAPVVWSISPTPRKAVPASGTPKARKRGRSFFLKTNCEIAVRDSHKVVGHETYLAETLLTANLSREVLPRASIIVAGNSRPPSTPCPRKRQSLNKMPHRSAPAASKISAKKGGRSIESRRMDDAASLIRTVSRAWVVQVVYPEEEG